MRWSSFAAALAGTRIGSTFNQYSGAPRLERRLAEYLERRSSAELLLVGEAAGYRGARVSGLPFTSERQLTASGPAEASATIVHRVLAEIGLEEHVLLWNVVPTHPHRPGRPESNRRPTAREIEASRPFLETLAHGRRVVPVGRVAEAALGTAGIRHPSHGGARAFRDGLAALV
jgi:uracil-DNA glycosylase